MPEWKVHTALLNQAHLRNDRCGHFFGGEGCCSPCFVLCMGDFFFVHDKWRRQMDAIRSAEEMERARKRTVAASELAAAAAAEYLSNKR